jgi:hypothetical protein
MSSMDRWRQHDRTVISLGYDAARRERAAANAPAYVAALRDGSAWAVFSQALRDLGPALEASGFAENETDLAEGYRYLLGLVTMRLNSILYAAGPEVPAFVRGMDDIVKVGLDNPDGINSYLAEIRDDRTYRLFGTVGRERYVEFVQFGASGTLANNFLDQFSSTPDGRFEIWLSREKRPDNHLELPPGAQGLLVRQVQYDWENEPLSEIRIEQPGVDALPECLRTPDPAQVAEELTSLGATLRDELAFWFDYIRAFSGTGENTIGGDQPLAVSGASAVRAAPKGTFRLGPDEALVLELEPPEGLFWSVAIGDVWFRSIDPSRRQSSLNGHTARVDKDGLCRIVVAHEDPGIANWLDTAGHQRGIVTFRYVRTTSRPGVRSRVVRTAELSEVLPPDTAQVTAAERAETIASRTRGFAARYASPFTSRWGHA